MPLIQKFGDEHKEEQLEHAHQHTHKKSLIQTLKNNFKKRHKQAVSSIQSSHQHVMSSVLKHKNIAKEVSKATARVVGAGALSSALLLAPVKPLELPEPPEHRELVEPKVLAQKNEDLLGKIQENNKKTLSRLLLEILPTSSPRNLTKQEEQDVSDVIKSVLRVNAYAQYEGFRLNTSYGYMGYEQHLLRYPGDSIDQHDEEQRAGMAPYTGAWGYFAPSQETMTEQNVQMEKYYFAVQTFLAPNWSENIYQTKEWFKFRKMIAINPETGDAVVGVVGDAGPAVWTGKTFGGSPELMKELHLNTGMKNGDVVLFFIDDPKNEIPLGPVQLKP